MAEESQVVVLQAQVRRMQAASETSSEWAEARARLTEYSREAEDWQDREAAALKTMERLRNHFGELHTGRARLETEVMGLKARFAELSYELLEVAANRDHIRQQVADRMSREAQLRLMMAE